MTSRSHAYRADGGLTAVLDRVAGVTRRLDLDVMGRITGVARQRGGAPDPRNWTERYAYDATGSVTQAGAPSDQDGTRGYAGSQVTRAGRVRYHWDRDGRMVSRVRPRISRRPDVVAFCYDSADRLTWVLLPNRTQWRYYYDAFGRRVSKEHLGRGGEILERVLFTWDGPLLVEETRFTDTVATRAWEHEPGSHRPIAQHHRASDALDQRFHAVVTDLIGTPTELITPDGAEIVWTLAPATVWGAPQRPARRGAPVGCPLRFPGQYHDPETGLHYNRHRYYDPDTNRYTTPDPLGLAPAPDPHSYVSNPTTWMDPLGLAPYTPAANGVENQIATVYRVEGPGNARLHISPTGLVSITGRAMLFLNFGDRARAQQFLTQRLLQGYSETVVKAFDVTSDFAGSIGDRSSAQDLSKGSGVSIIRVDITKTLTSYGLTSSEFEGFLQAIIAGSARCM